MKIAIVGIGLIGGSMAISLKANGFATQIIGVDKNKTNAQKALDIHLVDVIMSLDEAIECADIIILSTPVSAMTALLPVILNKIKGNQIVLDVGSTKEMILKSVENHTNRGQFVATHPMAGTEFSGPEAAIPNLFDGKCTVFVDIEKTNPKAHQMAEKLYKALKMGIVYLDGKAHDIHTAYISHISHISSFALALTVLEKEQDEKRIFELASGGFRSSVRLAKSSPDMWIPIFEQNRDNVLDVLDEHINTLAKFRSLLIKKNFTEFYRLIEEANDIQRILK
ncbi:MAG: prephenate dehydrogenase [Saprospiraceae bacterium]